MKIDILSLFPEMFGPLTESIVGKAVEKDILDIEVTNFSDFTTNIIHTVEELECCCKHSQSMML